MARAPLSLVENDGSGTPCGGHGLIQTWYRLPRWHKPISFWITIEGERTNLGTLLSKPDGERIWCEPRSGSDSEVEQWLLWSEDQWTPNGSKVLQAGTTIALVLDVRADGQIYIRHHGQCRNSEIEVTSTPKRFQPTEPAPKTSVTTKVWHEDPEQPERGKIIIFPQDVEIEWPPRPIRSKLRRLERRFRRWFHRTFSPKITSWPRIF